MVQWQMTEQSLSWKFNVSCTGVLSSNPQMQTELNMTSAGFSDLTSGDEYYVSVTAYFTNDIGKVYHGTETKRQAIGKLLPKH